MRRVQMLWASGFRTSGHLDSGLFFTQRQLGKIVIRFEKTYPKLPANVVESRTWPKMLKIDLLKPASLSSSIFNIFSQTTVATNPRASSMTVDQTEWMTFQMRCRHVPHTEHTCGHLDLMSRPRRCGARFVAKL